MQREERFPEANVAALSASVFTDAIGIFETYSEFEKPTRRFHAVQEFLEHIAESRTRGAKYFDVVVHYEGSGGSVATRRFDLNPERCGGARWREKTEGWGLVSFQLTYDSGGIVKGRIVANSEKRAKAWEETLKARLGPVAAWNWPVVERHCRRLVRRLRRDA